MPSPTGILAAGRRPAAAASWTPASLSGLVVWYEADQGVTSSGGAVSQWNDLSGNGHHLTQSNATNKPVDNSVTQNGLVTITFDATNDKMTVTGSVTEAPTNRIRYISVVYQTAAGGTPVPAEAGIWNPGGSDGFEYRLWTSASANSYDGDILESGVAHHFGTASSGVHSATTPYLNEVQCKANGSGIDFWRNAGTVRTNSDSFTFSSAGTTYTVGNSPIGCSLCSLIVVDGTVGGTADQTSLRSWLNAKWAVY